MSETKPLWGEPKSPKGESTPTLTDCGIVLNAARERRDLPGPAQPLIRNKRAKRLGRFFMCKGYLILGERKRKSSFGSKTFRSENSPEKEPATFKAAGSFDLMMSGCLGSRGWGGHFRPLDVNRRVVRPHQFRAVVAVVNDTDGGRLGRRNAPRLVWVCVEDFGQDAGPA